MGYGPPNLDPLAEWVNSWWAPFSCSLSPVSQVPMVPNIINFIADLFWVTKLWTVGFMPDNGILPPLPCLVSLTKARTQKWRNG
jgi:hypothetical protein